MPPWCLAPYGSIMGQRLCGCCPCQRCVFTSKLLTVAFMLPLQQSNTRISTLVCQEVGHWSSRSTAEVVRLCTVLGLLLNAGIGDPQVFQSRGGTLPLKQMLWVESCWLLRATENTALMVLWIMGNLKQGEAHSLPFVFQGKLVPTSRVNTFQASGI